MKPLVKHAKQNSESNPSDKKTELKISGMDCPDEVALINQALDKLNGILDVNVNLIMSKVIVTHTERLEKEKIIQAITSTGLEVVESEKLMHADINAENESDKKQLIFVVMSGALLASGLVYESFFGKILWIRMSIYILSVVMGIRLIFPKAFRSLKNFSLDMNVLMTTAVIGAIAIGQFSEAAAVTFLFSVAEYLESFSVTRARKTIESLMKLAPSSVFVKRLGQLIEVPIEDVKQNEVINVRSGDRIPLDGRIIFGSSSVDQASITGESIPVHKEPADLVYAGTINGEGLLEIQVTKESSDTLLAGIIKLIEDAQGQKAPSQNFVDKFARVYTPTVMMLAVLLLIIGPLLFGGAFVSWFYKSLVLLVIACPCALVISTPVSIVSGITALARRGVLVKGGRVLETLGKLKALAVDKTGTITEGKPQVTGVKTFQNFTEVQILNIAASLDAHSNHPLAQAVINYALQKKIELSEVTDHQMLSGRGVQGIIDKHVYFAGNHRFAHELNICSSEIESALQDIEEQAQSVVVVGHAPHDGHDGNVLGILSISDRTRENAKAAIQALHSAGIKKVVMLSGDNERTVRLISRQVGIDEAKSNLLPKDKITEIQDLNKRFNHVGMIGDGVNDAPAMAIASVGIAMGQIGSDAAIEAADVTLMQDDLVQVAHAIALGKRTLNIIKFNIGFSILIKIVFLVLASMGMASLWHAILADTGATLIVIANALRLLSR